MQTRAKHEVIRAICAGIAFGLVTAAMLPSASADVFNGTVFYTNFNGGQNVNKVDYSYDDATQSFVLSNQANIASTNGADGIIFAPNGNLLIGGQGSGNVYEVNPTTGAVVGTQFTGAASFHLSLDPNLDEVYTSSFGGALNTVNLPIGTGASSTAISGGDTGVTQVAFAPNGNVFYVNGNPNGGGNLGLINISTGVTNRLYTGIAPAHGLIYDSFTGLMTIFGAGQVGTFDQNGNNLLTFDVPNIGDFDQGATDGLGHALIAGQGSITFIDYRSSGSINNPDFIAIVGGFSGIDDVAPLSGLGSQHVPAPASLAVFGFGLLGLARLRRLRS